MSDDVIGRGQAEAHIRAENALDRLAELRPRWLKTPHLNGQKQFLESRHKIRIAIPGNGWGKGLAHGEVVLTPDGWTPIESIKVGDEVVGADGRATTVIGVYPQGHKPCFRVVFSDGADVVCDEDHLWTVRLRAQRFPVRREAPWATISTKSLYAHCGERPRGTRRPIIPMCDPVFLAAGPKLPIDPYVVGLLLGDGGLTASVRFSTADQELVEALARVWQVRHVHGYDYSLLQARADLEAIGIWGHRSYEKSIPDSYMRSSPEGRMALLRGLMDTDGSSMGNKDEFCTTSERLADQVVELVEGLGGVAVKDEPRRTTYGYLGRIRTGRNSWRIRITTSFCPYLLLRKAARWRPRQTCLNRKIVAIVPVAARETTCIKVAAADGLFLARRCVITHNTTTMAMAADMLIQKDDVFNPDMLPKHPVIGVWVCQKFQQMDILRKQLEEDVWTRPWTWNQTKHKYTWPNGGEMHIVSSDSRWEHIQGIPVDFVCFDEHPDRKLWNEFMYRRRGRRKTRYMVAATMTSGMTWFVKEVIQPWEQFHRKAGLSGEEARTKQLHKHTWVWDKGGIRDNPAMDRDDVEHYESIAHASEKEQQVRLHGGYADFTGESVFDQESLDDQLKNLSDGQGGALVLCDALETLDLYIPKGLDRGALISRRIGGKNAKHYIRFEGDLPVDNGRITIWEQPKIDCTYVMGADFAYGLVGRDYDYAVVLKKGEDGVCEQVAEARGWWGDADFAEILYMMGLYYFNAFLCGERQFGLPAMRRLYDEWHYPFIYRARQESTRSRRPSDLLGHHRSSGDTTIPNLRAALVRDHLVLRSRDLMEELRQYQYRPRASSMDAEDANSDDLITTAPQGMHDDGVMALAYAWHAAREAGKFVMPVADYAPGTYGALFDNARVLRGLKPRKPAETLIF